MLQNIGRAPNRPYQSAIYAAQDKESKESFMQEMWWSAEKEMSEHILCEFLVLEKIRMQTTGFARMHPDQVKEMRLSSIAVVDQDAFTLANKTLTNKRNK